MSGCCDGPKKVSAESGEQTRTGVTVTLVNGPGCGWGGDLLCDPGSEVGVPLQEGTAWDMPSAWRVHVIGEKLAGEGIAASLDEFDVYALPPELRHPVLDVVVAESAEFPMVLVNGRVVCHGGVDLDAVVRAAREVLASGGCC